MNFIVFSLLFICCLSFRELFTLDCNRRFHLTPNLPTASGYDISGYLSIVNAAFNEMYEQSKVKCPQMTNEEFNSRFGITLPEGFVRLFENDEFPPIEGECAERYHQEISVYYNHIKDLLPENPLPETCSYLSAAEGKCHFQLGLKPFTLQFAIESCPQYPGETSFNRVPFISVTCDGCDTFLKPCTADGDCGSDMKCELYSHYVNKIQALFTGNSSEFTTVALNEEDFFEFGWFDDLMKKSLFGYDFVTQFFHSVAEGYWGSGFEGTYGAYQFCFPDIDKGSDSFLNKYNITVCDDSNVTTGIYCDGKVALDPLVCSGRGDCVGDNECVCFPGFYGLNCEAEEYAHVFCNGVWQELPHVCSTHGTCENTGLCTCDDGFFGVDCADHPTCTPDCGTYGHCVATDTCVCEHHHYTKDPSLPCQELVYCGWTAADNYALVCGVGNGLCSWDEATQKGVCECDAGYGGDFCEDLISCDGKGPLDVGVCGELGECVVCTVGVDCIYPDTGKCVCLPHVSGEYCTFDGRLCDGKSYTSTTVCDNHGTCFYNEVNDAYECECDTEYYGSGCRNEWTCDNWKPASDPTSCGGHGDCIAHDTCDCEYPYTGQFCGDIITCDGELATDTANVCNGFGICTIDSKCVCDAEHWGEFCQLDVSCGGHIPTDPDVCDGTGICTLEGCIPMTIFDEVTDPVCTTQLLGIIQSWDGVMDNGEIVNSPARISGQNFPTQINRIRMEYDEEKPIPLFIYNGDGVYTVLPSHQYLGFAVYLQEFDRLLVLLDELFTSLREYHTDITDVVQKYYYKMWSPLPWLFRFTTYNVGNHLRWRRLHWDRLTVRFLRGYSLPKWWKCIEPPMSCTLKQYREYGNCTLRIRSLGYYFGGDFDVYVKFRRDFKDGPDDFTGFPHVEVWCDGALCHEMYNLKTCDENSDCKSKFCKTILQTTDYRLDTYVTPHSVYEIYEDDGTSFSYSAWNFTALFFEGSFFRMDFSNDILHPLSFYRTMLSLITGNPAENEDESEISICTLAKKERRVRPRRRRWRRWLGRRFWWRFRYWAVTQFEFEYVDNFWKRHAKWWKRGGQWWRDDDDDDDDDDDNERRGGGGKKWGRWGRWWRKKRQKWKKKKQKRLDREYVMKIRGIENWVDLFCLKKGGDDCGCHPGMVNCVCYEYSEDRCEKFLNTPQDSTYIVPGVKFVPQDDPPVDPGIQGGETAGATTTVIALFTFVVLMLVF